MPTFDFNPGSTANSHQWTLEAEDGAGIVKTLPAVTGDPSMGEILGGGGMDTELLRSRGVGAGYAKTEELEGSFTWTVHASDTADDFCDFCHARNKYAVAPNLMVSVNPVDSSIPAVKLRAIRTPSKAAPRVNAWEVAILKYTPKGGTASTTYDINFKCIGHSVT